MAQLPSYMLSLAGEYRVCSELIKRGVFATVTYGNHKSVDIYAIKDKGDRAIKIEVKTSRRAQFVTGIYQKGLHEDPTAPEFWVFFQLKPQPDDSFEERFFVLSHSEVCKLQKARNAEYAKRYRAKHGRAPDFSKGVDNLKLSDVEAHEDRWDKIVKHYQV